MDYKIPKLKTILAFLQSKGWEFQGTNELFYFLKPPVALKIQSAFWYRVPKNENAMDYEEYILHIVNSISQLYEIDKSELIALLSRSLDDIQKEVEQYPHDLELKRAILAYAS